MPKLNRKTQNRLCVIGDSEGYTVELNTGATDGRCFIAIYHVPYTGVITDDAAWKRDRAEVARFIRQIRMHVPRFTMEGDTWQNG